MIARAEFRHDRAYFEEVYGETVQHRLRYRKHALRWALVLLGMGLALLAASLIALVQRGSWSVGAGMFGALLTVIGIVRTREATQHRGRWIQERLRGTQDDKPVQLEFHEEHLTSLTPNSEGTLRYRALRDTCLTPRGVFLVTDPGVSIYVPASAFEQRAMFDALGEHLQRATAGREASDP